MPVSPEEYQKLLEREFARYHATGEKGGDRRDQAVRSANITAGYGNSTALRKPPRAAAKGAAAGPAETPAAPTPTPKPDIADLFVEPGIGSGYPTPPPREPGIGSGYPTPGPPQPQFPEVWGVQPGPPQPQFPEVWGVQPGPPQPQFPEVWGEQPEDARLGPPDLASRTRLSPELRELFRRGVALPQSRWRLPDPVSLRDFFQ